MKNDCLFLYFLYSVCIDKPQEASSLLIRFKFNPLAAGTAGQIELYTHIPVMRQLADKLQNWNFRLCGVFLLDAQFLLEPSKFVSGMMTALSTMVNLELPHVNIMSKLDLLSKKDKKQLDR